MNSTKVWMILLAYSGYILLGISAAVIGPLWANSLQATFNESVDALGWVLLTAAIGYIVGSVNSARLFARFSTAGVFALSTFIAAVGFAGYAISPTWLMVVGFGFVSGFGTGIMDGGTNIYFAAYFNERLMNWLHASFGVGSLLAPQLINLIVVGRPENWRLLYLLLAGLFLVVSATFVLTRHWWQPLQTSEEKRKTSDASTFRLPIVWIGILLFIFYTGAEATAGSWGVSLFDSRGVNLTIANNWISAYWLSFTIGRIFFGVIITRLNTDMTIRLCLLAATCAALLMWANPSELLSGVGIVVYGFALSPIFALMISLTQARLGPIHAPNAIAASVAAAGMGAGILPAVVGLAVRLSNFEIVPIILVGLAASMLAFYQFSMAQGFKLKVETAVP